MSGMRLRGGGVVLVSLAVHATVIVGVSALALRTPVAPLFVDLTQEAPAGTATRAGGSMATSTGRGPIGGDPPAPRRATASSRAVAPVPQAAAPQQVVERPTGTMVAPSPVPSAPSSSPPAAPEPLAPASAEVKPRPTTDMPAATAPATVAPTPEPADGSAARPSTAGVPMTDTLAAPGPGRAVGTASEVGGAGTGRSVSTPGGARLALALPGDGRGEVPAEYGPYLARFRRSVEDAIVYPLAARRQGLAGRVELDVLLEPDGRVTAVKIHSSSSHGVLDEAGVAAVRSLPSMPFPEGLPRRPLLIRLPLDFQLR